MTEKTSKKETAEKSKTQKPCCGIIMPISEIDGCPAQHWADVKDVLLEVIGQTEFEGDLVSNTGEIRIIHEIIVQNIYNNEMIICDVSGKNPNVMFELGLRLAFDKPAIIIKDDQTNYSFDTSPIEHLEYPRDLNYKKINDFKLLLKEKLIATHKKSATDTNYSPFLKSFGQFKVAQIETKEVSSEQFIMQELREIKDYLWKLPTTNTMQSDVYELTKHYRPISKDNSGMTGIVVSKKPDSKSEDVMLSSTDIINKINEYVSTNSYTFEIKPQKNVGISMFIKFFKPVSSDVTNLLKKELIEIFPPEKGSVHLV